MKYVVFSFDDGTIHDIKLLELMNQYNIKGTFNLNSGLAGYVWSNAGKDVIRPDLRSILHIYEGHEVACHSLTHPRLDVVSEEKLHDEIERDKGNLEGLFQKEIHGFAIPFDTWSEHVVDVIKGAGFSYARLPLLTESYHHPEDNFHLACNAFTFSSDLNFVLDDFLRKGRDGDILLIGGHSYEFYCNNSWGYIEGIFRRIRKEESLKSVTTLEALRLTRRLDA